MIYAKVCDASALERLDAALCQATSLKWYRRLLIINSTLCDRETVSTETRKDVESLR